MSRVSLVVEGRKRFPVFFSVSFRLREGGPNVDQPRWLRLPACPSVSVASLCYLSHTLSLSHCIASSLFHALVADSPYWSWLHAARTSSAYLTLAIPRRILLIVPNRRQSTHAAPRPPPPTWSSPRPPGQASLASTPLALSRRVAPWCAWAPAARCCSNGVDLWRRHGCDGVTQISTVERSPSIVNRSRRAPPASPPSSVLLPPSPTHTTLGADTPIPRPPTTTRHHCTKSTPLSQAARKAHQLPPSTDLSLLCLFLSRTLTPPALSSYAAHDSHNEFTDELVVVLI